MPAEGRWRCPMPSVSCPRCRTIVQATPGGTPVCPKCGFGREGGVGVAAPNAGMAAVGGHGQRKGMAVASMVLGIVGIVFLCIPFAGAWIALPAGLVAVILGGVSLSQAKQDPTVGGQGMAITGLVLGIIVLALAVLVLLVIGSLLANLGSL